MYRKNNRRGNSTMQEGPAKLIQRWEARLSNGRVMQATAVEGAVFAVIPDTFRVVALDANTGKEKWRFSASSRVNVAPTIVGGRCVFGSRDGWVYCLDAERGGLIWKRRGAPLDHRIMLEDRLESMWPVIGGVLVREGAVYFVNGHHGSINGGLFVHAVKLETGETIWTRPLKHHTAVGDFLTAVDGKIFFNSIGVSATDGTFDLAHQRKARGTPVPGVLATRRPVGIAVQQLLWDLENIPPVRDPLVHDYEGQAGAYLTDGRLLGEVLAFDGNRSFSSGHQKAVALRYNSKYDRKNKDKRKKERDQWQVSGEVPGKRVLEYGMRGYGPDFDWRIQVQHQLLALVHAGGRLYAAGVPLDRDATKKPQLWIVSAKDGKILESIELDARPAPDGLSVANGSLYLGTEDGRLLCFGEK
jgi:outer membrane protein assembly factor BamB